MASALGNFVHSIWNWASAADLRYREACKMMELTDDVLDDIGITREELMVELGIRPTKGTKARPSGQGETSLWTESSDRQSRAGIRDASFAAAHRGRNGTSHSSQAILRC